MKLRIDKVWHKIYSRTDTSGEYFVISPKMVKCALGHCQSNAEMLKDHLVQTKEC